MSFFKKEDLNTKEQKEEIAKTKKQKQLAKT